MGATGATGPSGPTGVSGNDGFSITGPTGSTGPTGGFEGYVSRGVVVRYTFNGANGAVTNKWSTVAGVTIWLTLDGMQISFPAGTFPADGRGVLITLVMTDAGGGNGAFARGAEQGVLSDGSAVITVEDLSGTSEWHFQPAWSIA